jgi:hypothetical protein
MTDLQQIVMLSRLAQMCLRCSTIVGEGPGSPPEYCTSCIDMIKQGWMKDPFHLATDFVQLVLNLPDGSPPYAQQLYCSPILFRSIAQGQMSDIRMLEEAHDQTRGFLVGDLLVFIEEDPSKKPGFHTGRMIFAWITAVHLEPESTHSLNRCILMFRPVDVDPTRHWQPISSKEG